MKGLGGDQAGEPRANANERDGRANQANHPSDRPRESGATENGKGSGAGSGSAAGGLLASGSRRGASAAGEEMKTFKVTLTSFLQGVPVKPAPEPKARPGRVADVGLAAPSQSSTALSDQQLGDDLMRKPEIPPEYEEIVRRVYSQRPES